VANFIPKRIEAHETVISFFQVHQFAGWDKALEMVKQLILLHSSHRVLEAGCGANATLPIDYIQRAGIEYTINDISAEELAKAPPGYQKLVLDLGCDSLPKSVLGRYDFIFSRMVNEHVKDAEVYYRNIHDMLASGGVTAHWFSTLYALPFLINRLAPDWLAKVLGGVNLFL
jgi:SAM-dependent methyltransferase